MIIDRVAKCVRKLVVLKYVPRAKAPGVISVLIERRGMRANFVSCETKSVPKVELSVEILIHGQHKSDRRNKAG
jgi:hypothetical protein